MINTKITMQIYATKKSNMANVICFFFLNKIVHINELYFQMPSITFIAIDFYLIISLSN